MPMTTIHYIYDRDSKPEKHPMFNVGEDFEVPEVEANWWFHDTQDKKFIPKRTANKLKDDYAVTKLPFVLLAEEDELGDNEIGFPYAAVYSEEGPITIERIKNKL